MRSQVSTAPDGIRSELRRTTGKQLVTRCSTLRSTGGTDPTTSKKEAIRCLKRYVARGVFDQLPRHRLA